MAFYIDGFLALFLLLLKQIWCSLTKYFQRPLATRVLDETTVLTDDIQFNVELCKRLVKKIAKTKKHIKQHGPFREKQVLQELDLVMKRADGLLQQCMGKKSKQYSWLYAAVDLVGIKEDVLEIELDLTWWTSLLNISGGSDTADWKEDTVVTMALEQLKTSNDKLSVEGSSLQDAASIDKRNLQAMLAQVKNKRPFSAKEKEVHFLSVYLLSRLNDIKSDSSAEDSTLIDRHFCDLRRTESELGSGAFGKVVEVTWLQRMKCAMKVIKVEKGSSMSDKRKKEGNILKFCTHPNIVRFIWSWEQENEDNENVPHILMERMHTDLSTLIEKQTKDESGPPFELHVAIDIMLQIAKAMRYIHSKKITHRDLKPGNVLVQLPEGGKLPRGTYVRVKLADFGLSKSYSGTETFSSQTAKQGTSVYAAPEVFLPPVSDPEKLIPPRAKFPPRADVWSFAVTCSEILTGKSPFSDSERGNLHYRIKEEGIRPALPHDLPVYLRFCIVSCWNYFADQRPNFQNICRMLCLAKAMSLGILPIDFCTRPLFRSNNPMWQSALHPTGHRTGHEVGETWILIGTSFRCYKNKSMDEELREERGRSYYQTGIQAVEDEYRCLKPIRKVIMQGCCWAQRVQGIAHGCLSGVFVSSKYESELRKMYVRTVEGGFLGETDHESISPEVDKCMWGEKNLHKMRRGIRHVGCFYCLGESAEKQYVYLYFKYGLSTPALISHLWHEDALILGDRNTADDASIRKTVLGSKIFTSHERERHHSFFLAVSSDSSRFKSDVPGIDII